MKIALLCYHKNLQTYIPKEWVYQYAYSILNQDFTNVDIVIYEYDYGGTDEQIFSRSTFFSKEQPTFIHALNSLLDVCQDNKIDFVFNTNVDDWYSSDWVSKQLALMFVKKFDLVSCNFSLVNGGGIPYFNHQFHTVDVAAEVQNGHNVFAHPAVLYSREFIKKYRYKPEEQPEEDLKLWQRAAADGCRFGICEENLLFHRIHKNSVCNSDNK